MGLASNRFSFGYSFIIEGSFGGFTKCHPKELRLRPATSLSPNKLLVQVKIRYFHIRAFPVGGTPVHRHAALPGTANSTCFLVSMAFRIFGPGWKHRVSEEKTNVLRTVARDCHISFKLILKQTRVRSGQGKRAIAMVDRAPAARRSLSIPRCQDGKHLINDTLFLQGRTILPVFMSN